MERVCCLCDARVNGWQDAQPIVFEDPADGKRYCIFHAPKDEKRKGLGSEDCYTLEEFNNLIIDRIENVILRVLRDEKEARCNLSRTCFPGDILFFAFEGQRQLPSISFFEATFNGSVSFFKSHFSERVDFHGATFKGPTSFHEVTFTNTASFTGVKSAKDGNLLLLGMKPSSLKHIIFTPAELPFFTLNQYHWPNRLGLEIHGGKSLGNLLGCERLYRAMKKRADEEHDRKMVSEWHYREKLMGLKQLSLFPFWLANLDTVLCASCSWLTRLQALTVLMLSSLVALPRCIFSLTFWYCITSGFGEGMIRAGGLLGLLTVLPFLACSPFGHAVFQGIWSQMPWLHGLSGQLTQFRDTMNATAAMQFIPFTKDIGGDGWVKVAQGIWHLLIIIQGTLFALAVRNRFRR